LKNATLENSINKVMKMSPKSLGILDLLEPEKSLSELKSSYRRLATN
jgi:hypothetical protein